MQDKISIIIPAAGLGRRMKSYGPKCLIDLNGQSLLTRQLNIIKNIYKNADIVLVLGFDAEKVYRIIPSDVRVVENELYEETNVARSISLGLRACSMDANKVLIVYGDLVFNPSTLNIPLEFSNIVIDSKNQIKDTEVGLTTINDYVGQFSYGLSTKWGQIAFLTGKELRLFKEIIFNKDYKKYYGFEILNMVIDNGGKLKTIEPKNMKIAEIDTSKDIEVAKNIIEEK